MERIIVNDDNLDTASQVTKKEWKQILLDENFMSNNYKFALCVFFLEPDHKATCKYLAEKYNTLPESIRGFITEFCRAVQRKSNRFELIKESGKQFFWPIAMTGRRISGGLFEWRLRQELVEAILELDYVASNAIPVHNLADFVQLINKDLREFINTFRKVRKILSNKERATTAGILFKDKGDNADWAINEGGHNEIQYHIFLREQQIGYGLGFNAQYVPFNNEKTSLELITPFVNAFLSLQDSDEVKVLKDRGFEIDLTALKTMSDGGYNLFGRVIPLVNEKLSLIDYYSILNDLKGDLFNLYQKIFENANEIRAVEKKEALEVGEQNPLIQRICELLKTNKNIILTGAPGTGKTYLAKEVVKALDGKLEFVQFHPSYDYTDFVEGLRPTQNNEGEVGFELRDGIFKAFCKEALKYQKNQTLSNFEEVYQRFTDDISETGLALVTPSQNKPFRVEINSQKNCKAVPDTIKQTEMIVTKNYIQTYLETGRAVDWKPYVVPICDYIKDNYDLKLAPIANHDKKFIIILDEINRAEVSKVLGELFYCIDPAYRGETGSVKTQYANLQTEDDVFKDGFYIPDNVYIIGTMNDIDRSVESFDFAMRRRFAWLEIKAKDRLSMWEGNIDPWIDEASRRLHALNTAIETIEGLNSAYHVGPAYFLKLANYQGDFEALWHHHLESLLFEYLRGYPDADQQLAKLKVAYDGADINVDIDVETDDHDSNHG